MWNEDKPTLGFPRLTQECLEDKVVHEAMVLLASRFPELRLANSCTAAFFSVPLEATCTKILQLVNTSMPKYFGNASATQGALSSVRVSPGTDDMVVCDSLNKPCSKDLTEVIRNLHGRSGGTIRRAKAQQQRDGHSCGAMAIANTVSVAIEFDSGRQRYRTKNVTSR